MSERPRSRGTRGNYAKLICLQCRGRKIKCQLPENAGITPSEVPQPDQLSCQRCRALGLECIVQETVLGRPVAKRKRTRGGVQAEGAAASIATAADFEVLLDEEEVKSYLLSEFTVENFPPHSFAPCAKIAGLSVAERFEAMISSTHMLSALLSRDQSFGSRSIAAQESVARAKEPVCLSKTISHGMAALLDENLSWHRFLEPATPRLVELKQQLEYNGGTPGDPGTPVLFALLALMAVEMPSSRLRDDVELRVQLRRTLDYFGEPFILAPPVTRNALAALLLLSSYRPTALIKHQDAAAAAVKSDVSIAQAHRTARKLGLSGAHFKLSQPLVRSPDEVEALVGDCLQWCSLIKQDAFADAFFAKSLHSMRSTHIQLDSPLETLVSVLQHHTPTIRTLLHFHLIVAATRGVQCLIDIKHDWRDLKKLADVVETYEQTCQKELTTFQTSAKQARPHNDREEEVLAASTVLTTSLEHLQASISGVAMFFALMSRLKPQAHATDIEPKDALQVSEQIISSLQDLRIGRAFDLANRLARLGADTLKLEGVPYAPQPREEALATLYWCRILVENSAVRMKGWGGLHPDVDKQLELMAGCARRLEIMATPIGGSLQAAFEKGCLYAACAKLIRCLHRIVLGWQGAVNSSTRGEDGASWEGEPGVDAGLKGLDADADVDFGEFDFDELFAQWSSWPQSEGVDFLSCMPDDLFMS